MLFILRTTFSSHTFVTMNISLVLLLASIAVAAPKTRSYGTELMTSVQGPVEEAVWKLSPDTTVCGDKLCTCNGTSANCSNHADGLQYIPRLPHNITDLDFSNNHLKGIFRDDFFKNVAFIRRLSLFGNPVAYISPGAFRMLRHLTYLSLDYNNKLDYPSLQSVFVPTLQRLFARRSNLGAIPRGFFDNATSPELSVLLLYDNRIGDTRLSVFKHLKGLTVLGLANNSISHFEVDTVNEKLISLNLNTNGLFSIPETCYNGSFSRLPSLTHLLLATNMISSVGQVCLPKLQVLTLSENSFSILPTDTFGGHKFPNLIELYIYSMNNRLNTIQKDAFNNPSLQRISMFYNGMDFSHKTIDARSFANCPQLRYLQLSHSYMTVTEERFLQLFGYLDHMEYLYLENAQIGNITERMFSGFPLLKVLKLDRNLLSAIPDGTFDGLKNLNTLILSNNQLTEVPPTTFNAATRNRLSTLDLSNNPFTCSCQVLWFRSWLISDPHLFSQSWGPYKCFNLPGVSVRQFFLDEQACLLSHSASVMITVSSSIVLVTLMVIFILFRYRWHFRLWLYEVFRGHGDARRRRLENCDFDYDVFVSYDADDSDWVLQHLQPVLEGRLRLRLCLHQRDFIVGRDIVDNIYTSVERSKKVMMVFSNNFVQSQWCQFELSLCLSYVMDYDDALIIVCLDDIPSRDLTAAMMAVMKTTTYIQWMDDDDAIASFWGRVHIALREIMHHRE